MPLTRSTLNPHLRQAPDGALPLMVTATNVNKAFTATAVLSDVSFSVEAQSSFVILGQSGSGKSVLLKLLAHLMTVDSGNITIETRNVGMLFQKNALFDSLTVQENLDFPLKYRSKLSLKERSKKIDQFLEWVELKNTHTLFPDELSGGMQKRLGIARALIVEPELIFYDEPTAGLDPITSRLICDLIKRLKEEMKSTIVVITSEVQRAYQLADQMGILIKAKPFQETIEKKESNLILTGSPSQTEASQDPRVKQFVKGLAQGPLTDRLNTENPTPSQRRHDQLRFRSDLPEGYDVDFF